MTRIVPVVVRWRPTIGDAVLIAGEETIMCRAIKPLFNYEPPTTDAEIEAAARQFVRKVSGFNKPSQTNQAAFDRAVADVTQTVRELLDVLVTTAPPRDRNVEAARAAQQSARRFGPRPAA
jgi:hypothetical protein